MVHHRRVRPGEKIAMVKYILNIKTDWCLLWPLAHADRMARRICKAAHGEKPNNDYEVAHSCNRKLCINHHHVRWATREENMADRKFGKNPWTMTIEFK